MTVINVQLSNNSEDVKEEEASGNVTTGGANVFWKGHSTEALRFWGGLRFNGVNIPQGSTINSVRCEFVSLSAGGDARFFIHCQLIASAPLFSLGVTSDVTGRSRTVASVSWNVDNVGAGQVFCPDFTAVLQELVNAYTITAVAVIFRSMAIDGDDFSFRNQGSIPGDAARISIDYSPVPTAAITGTVTIAEDPEYNEADVNAGGDTIIITLTDDTWDPTLGADNALTQDLIDGIDSDVGGASGWDAVVKAGLDYTHVDRTSPTVCTITMPAFAGYNSQLLETIEVTVPASALVTSADPVVATPTFVVRPVGDVSVECVGFDADATETNMVTGLTDALAANVFVTHGIPLADRTAVGLRFSGISIPWASVITMAHIEVKPLVAGTRDKSTMDIYLQPAAAPGVFLGTGGGAPAFDVSGRSRTTASVAWDTLAGIGTGNFKLSPSLVAAVQEVIDSYTPTAIVVLLIPRAVANPGAPADPDDLSWDSANGARTPAKLQIDFTPPPPQAPRGGILSSLVGARRGI